MTGLLYDMLGRLTGARIARERTVQFHAAAAITSTSTQAERVESTVRSTSSSRRAENLAPGRRAAGAPGPEVGCTPARDRAGRFAHSGYHRHGAYLLENADMPGFAARRAAAARAPGRRSPPQALPRAGVEELDATLGPAGDLVPDRAAAAGGAAAPRPQHHGAAGRSISAPDGHARWKCAFRRAGSREHPLTSVEDLQQEVDYLRASGFRLRVFSAR